MAAGRGNSGTRGAEVVSSHGALQKCCFFLPASEVAPNVSQSSPDDLCRLLPIAINMSMQMAVADALNRCKGDEQKISMLEPPITC